MYQKKLEKDIRCPLEYGLEILEASGIPESSVYWQKRRFCVTVRFEKKWETLLMQYWLPP